ncbi:MAG: hypothetical protein ACR2PT_23355 [Endozoicomonas sp.]
MTIRYLLGASLLIAGCSFDGPDYGFEYENDGSYNEQWSKAKNLTYVAGMDRLVHDQQLPGAAYRQDGKLKEDKLGNILHAAHGSASGMTGVNVKPHGPFEDFYWGWTVPGSSHYGDHRLFAWMPDEMAQDSLQARKILERILSRSSLAILEEMHYKYKPVQAPYVHEGVRFQQWYLQDAGGECSFTNMNCVLSLYIPEPVETEQAPYFSYFSTAGQPAWFFPADDPDRFPRLSINQGDGLESVAENVFYQKLSARLPGWIYLYFAPDEVGMGENNQTIAYPYLLEKGKPLLFVRPSR